MSFLLDLINLNYSISFLFLSISLFCIFAIITAKNGFFRLLLSFTTVFILLINSYNMLLITGIDRSLKTELLNFLNKDKEYRLLSYYVDENQEKIFLFVKPKNQIYPLHLSIPYNEEKEKEIKQALKQQQRNQGTAKMKIKGKGEKKEKGEQDITKDLHIFNESYIRDVPLKEEFPDEMMNPFQ